MSVLDRPAPNHPVDRPRPQARDLVAWAAVVPWALWAAWRLGGWPTRWPAPTIIAFSPYVVATSFLPVVVALLLRRRVAAIAAIAVAAALLATALPRHLAAEQPPADGPSVTVLSANLRFGAANPWAVVAAAAEADVFVAVELTDGMVQALEDAGLSGHLPHAYLDPGTVAEGAGVWSRWPVTFLEDHAPPGSFAAPRVAVAGPDGTTLEVVAVHPHAPRTPGIAHRWARSLAALPPTSPGAMRILAGDFNATLDHPELRAVLDRGYVDAADEAGAGLAPTWPSNSRFPPGVTIDHVLVDPRIAVRGYRTLRIPGTDHRAILTRLQLPAAG